MHLIIFIHLTALYCRLPSAANKNVEAHPFSSTFLSTKILFLRRSRSARSTFALLLLQFRQGLIPGITPKEPGERRNCIYVLQRTCQNLLQVKHIQDLCISGYVYGIIWDMRLINMNGPSIPGHLFMMFGLCGSKIKISSESHRASTNHSMITYGFHISKLKNKVQ